MGIFYGWLNLKHVLFSKHKIQHKRWRQIKLYKFEIFVIDEEIRSSKSISRKHWPDQTLSSKTSPLKLSKILDEVRYLVKQEYQEIYNLSPYWYYGNVDAISMKKHFNNNRIIVFLLLSEQSKYNNDRPLNVYFNF